MASQMERFVNCVVTLSAEGNFSKLCEEINKNLDFLRKSSSNLDMVLETLDPQLHSLGYLAILNIKFKLPSSSAPEFESLFSQTRGFFSLCNGEQVRFATDVYATLAHDLTKALVDKKQCIRGIQTLCKAITKIQMHATQLTSIHADLCQLCLLAKCMTPALPYLDVDITDIGKEGGHFDETHFLCYYYYGGMCYAALKKWDRALYFFEVAITTPSMAVSHIMLEAYKKHIVVSLIHHGKVKELPRYTSQTISRFVKPLSLPYQELASCSLANNPQDLRAVIFKHFAHFRKEDNLGLVMQVVNAVFDKNIQRLTKTFLTLSLSDIARRVGLESANEAEQRVLKMIEEGQIYASINKKDGMVSFHDNPEKYNNPQMLKNLDDKMREFVSLESKLRQMDQNISVTPVFIQKSLGINDEDDGMGFASGSK